VARNTMEAWLREEQDSQVIRRLNLTSVAETALRSVPMSGNVKTEPRMVDMDVEVVPKGGAYGEDTGANDEVTLTARKFGRALRVAEEDIDDNIVDVINAKKEGWVSSFAVAFDNAVFGTSAAENGTTVPFTSIYRALNTTNAATGYTADANIVKTAGAITYDDLSDVAGLVEASGGYSAGVRNIFVAHPIVKGVIRKLKDSTGNPIFTPSPRQGDPDTLFGYPVRWSDGAVVTATVSSKPTVVAGGGAEGAAGNPLIFFGNPDFAIVGKRSGPESVVIDGRDGLSALTDETILKVRARRAFVLAHEKAWAVIEVTNA
jgi:HK97 family phage major capsid protein